MRSIGLLGATGIAERAILTPAAARDDVRVHAVAASDPGRAEAFRDKHGLPVAHRGYRELIEDPAVDTVYLSLHNSAHAAWAAEAARRGKHVLVEKPLCPTRREAVALRRAGAQGGVRVVETVMTAGHPWQAAARALIAAGELGELRSVTTRITFDVLGAGGYRVRPELGGGALFDTAAYWLQAVQAVIGTAGATAGGHSGFAGPNGVDDVFTATLTWPGGVRSELRAALTGPARAEHEFAGTAGRLRVRNFLLPAAGRLPLNMTVVPDAGPRRVVALPATDYYADQLDRILTALDRPGGPEEDEAVERVTLMEQAYLAALS
jgi:predicted dehydrogenase